MDNEIPLSEAPDRFLNQEKWRELVAAMGGREAALEQISLPDPGVLAYARQIVAELPNADGARARREQKISLLATQIVEEFRERLRKGELIATALSLPNLSRARIPPELWTELWPNFVANQAKAGSLTLTHVRISDRTLYPRPDSTIVQRCTDWIRQRHEADGEERKKVLLREAREYFGADIKVRDFDAAYKAIFDKKRGRPRRKGCG